MSLSESRFQEILASCPISAVKAKALYLHYFHGYQLQDAALKAGIALNSAHAAKKIFSFLLNQYQDSDQELSTNDQVPVMYLIPPSLKDKLDDIVLNLLEEENKTN